MLKGLKKWLRRNRNRNRVRLPAAWSSRPEAESARRIELQIDHRCCVCNARAIQAPRALAGSDGEWYGGYFCITHFCQPGWLVIH